MNLRLVWLDSVWVKLSSLRRPGIVLALGFMLFLPLEMMLAVSGCATVQAYAGSLEDGQANIEQGEYHLAIDCFTQYIENHPTEPLGYRGRIEALLMLRKYSDAMRDVARFNAVVIPADPGSIEWILTYYEARIAADPSDVAALTGGSFAYWWNFDYATALGHLESLNSLAPDNPYGILFRGSSKLLAGEDPIGGEADFEAALALDPFNPHARFIVADGYTYGLPNPSRAFVEASLARWGGLDTPRINAILAASFEAFGNMPVSAYFLRRHIEQVTTHLVALAPLGNNKTRDVIFAPGMTVEIPVTIQAGKKIRIETASPSDEVYDTIAVLLAPNGIPLTGSDDTNEYFAAFQWTAPVTATYKLRVTTFEAVATGLVRIQRK